MKSTRSAVMSIAVLAVAGMCAAGWADLSRAQTSDWRYEQDSRWRRMGDGRNRQQRMLRANSDIDVRIDSEISTKNVQEGDSWTGRVTRDVISDGEVAIPAGSRVEGVVTMAVQGSHNIQAQLGLATTAVRVNGRRMAVNADTEPIVAGSRRAKRIGAVAGGAAVGAIVGGSVSGKKGGLIGGLLGGLVGYGATQNKFRTLELDPGTEITFTTRQDLYARR